MEKNCLTCKYYYNRQCNNKTLPIEPESNIEDITTEFIEEGILSGSLQELLTNKELKRIFLNDFIHRIIDKDYIKKNKIDKLLQDSYSDDDEINIIEELDNTISIMLKRYFKNSISNIKITQPEEFYCSNWE